MATTKTNNASKAFLDYTVYVPLGAAKLAADKAKELSDRAWKLAKDRSTTITSAYEELADRGKELATGVRNSPYTKRAAKQIKTARSQVKAAATSVRMASTATADATREAAKKVS